jgi:GNAT superfamily N-acetyltransferase
MQVRALTALPPADLFTALARIDAIFFEASSVQGFDSPAHRFAFHWLWLGRYLIEEPAEAFVAIEDGAVTGYLVGSLVDPAPRAAFASLDYFKAFADRTAAFPAHLHVNVAANARGRRVGERLVGAFERHAAVRGAPGVHVVTGAGMRNVGFYERLGYREAARAPRGAGHVVMLTKRLL